MKYEYILIEKENHIAIVRFNRPEVLNALNDYVLKELNLILDELINDDYIYVIIVTGNGKAFISGADIAAMQEMKAEEARKFSQLGLNIFRKLELMEKPVIAAINGFALGGGCELSMSCDIRIASEKAKFGQPEVGLGIIPGFGGTQRMSRLIGEAKAKELIFTGSIVNAEDAESMGLVNKVVPHERLMTEALAIANQIVSNAQFAVRYSKLAINRGYETDIETGMEIEKNLFGLCFTTQDRREGIDAYIDKRKANFKNR